MENKENPTNPIAQTIPIISITPPTPKPNRKRDILLRVFVTEAERDFIYEKMSEINTNNFGAYARKMLIDGYVISIDTSDMKAIAAECQKIGVNINQIARRVNSTTRIYEQDFEEIKRWIAEIWRILRLCLLKQR